MSDQLVFQVNTPAPSSVDAISSRGSKIDALAGSLTAIDGVYDDISGADTVGTVAADLLGANYTGQVGENIADVIIVSGINADVSAVADIDAETVVVAGISTKVTTVANDTVAINGVWTDLDGTDTIGTVATNLSGTNTIGTVAAIDGNVTTVAGISANVTTVAGVSANVTTVAGISGNVTTVAGISANVTAVAGNNANVTTVATDLDLGASSKVTITANSIANVNLVGGSIANVNTVAGISGNVTTVAGISANVTTVAGISGDVATVAGNNANVTIVADNDANITIAATTVASVAQDRFLGRQTAGAGAVEQLTAAQVRTILNIEDGATGDMSASEIGNAYEGLSNRNQFDDNRKAKLDGIEVGATADQSASEIGNLYEGLSNRNQYSDSEKTKLASVETGATNDSSVLRWSEYERSAILYQSGIVSSPLTTIQYPVAALNHIGSTGQSNDQGYECHPVLNTAAVLNVQTLGQSVQAAGGASWNAIGGATLQGAIARVFSNPYNSGDPYLDSAEIAALAYGDDNRGDTPVLGMANAFARRQAAYQNALEPAGDIVVTSAGQGGQDIEYLENAGFERMGQSIGDVEAAAPSTYAYFATPMVHGESDYNDGTTQATYESKAGDFFDNINARALSEAGQSAKSLKMLVSCAADSRSDTNDLAIDMAQWALARDRDDVILACPMYPYPDKGVHNTSNGARWLGENLAKVADRIFLKREGWTGFVPYRINIDPNDSTVWYATFLVPNPPLVFRDYYEGNTATDRTDKGFRVYDDTGDVTVTPTLEGACTVKLSLSRELGTNPRFSYAGDAQNGSGNLADSDPSLATTNYEFVTDMDASENIVALVDKPYPLRNWAWPVNVPIPFNLETFTG